jgi:His Kinase A (phospho-acceptor) domain
MGFDNLRVDDRLETALRNSAVACGSNASGQWRQLIDLLAQNPLRFAAVQVATGLVRARQIRDSVQLHDRVAAVQALAGRIMSPPLVQLLAGDAAPVAAAAIAGARLNDEQWADMVPYLPVRARGFLRLRSDLGPLAQRALMLHAGGDFVLPSGVVQPLPKPAEQRGAPRWNKKAVPIGEVVERLEQWRRDHIRSAAPQLPFEDISAPVPATEIRFETDDNGTVIWVEGAPRGAIVGIDIAHPAYDNGPGPDAYGAAAFRQRMPMENARMRLRGASVVEGDWRISASPFFDAQSGRFRGFRGIMRRPTVAEHAETYPDPARQAEQLQQILHELRTPLGAVVGFAEIIEQQMFGPVADEYRGLAANIVTDANQLLSGFDDLAIAAQMDRGALSVARGVTECSWLAVRLAERLQAISNSLNVDVNLAIADPVRSFAVDQEMAERLFSRLLSAVIMGCGPGETLHGRFSTAIGQYTHNHFQLTLPNKLARLSEDEMLGAGPAPSTNVAASPLLGLGFSLRLVRNLARNVGGSLHFQNESLLITLPAVQDNYDQGRDQWSE